MAKIELLTLVRCAPCDRAKSLLVRHGIEYTPISARSEEAEELLKISNIRTVPQLFVDGTFMGYGLNLVNRLRTDTKFVDKIKATQS